MQVLKHPCFELHPTGHYARIHLPVAPKCNIQCRYCDRRYDCANESRPGVTSKILTDEEALCMVENAKSKIPELSVVGVAGPGEPLYNEETFRTLESVKKRFPDMIACVSTNGVLLEERLGWLLDCGVETLTVTMNTLLKEKIPLIYHHTGRSSFSEFSERQKSGIRKAAEQGIKVKINMVLIPGINEDEVIEIASFGERAGAVRMNLMPLIPQAEFSDKQRPTVKMLFQYRSQAEKYLPQMYHCRQCRADACGFL